MSGEIRHLFVTLKRSFAGTRDTHVKIVKSLGLRHREQTVQKPNVASVRGAIDKVPCTYLYLYFPFYWTESSLISVFLTGKASGHG